MRVFFGLLPDPDFAMQLATWRDRQFSAAGRPVPPANFHITLAFVGEIKPHYLETLGREVSEWCDRATPAGGRLSLDQTGYWPRPGIYWLGPARWPDQLQHLADRLRTISAGAGGKRERKRFQPHITLFRGCRDAPPAPSELPRLTFDYSEFALFESRQGRQGVSYHPLEYWELARPRHS